MQCRKPTTIQEEVWSWIDVYQKYLGHSIDLDCVTISTQSQEICHEFFDKTRGFTTTEMVEWLGSKIKQVELERAGLGTTRAIEYALKIFVWQILAEDFM
jgi:hypothetical protein